MDEKFQLIHPQGKPAPRIARWKYEALRTALLEVIPSDKEGIPFDGLADRVEAQLPHKDAALIGSISWFMTHVKLDLEARGEIERVPGSSPQRLRRKI